jgi:hypothetical protein
MGFTEQSRFEWWLVYGVPIKAKSLEKALQLQESSL